MLPHRLRTLIHRFPRQHWYLMTGMFINSTGMGMIWPFFTIYLRQRLGMPLTTITLLLTLDSLMSVASSFLSGPVSDRFGRKGVMVLSLGMMGVVYIFMSQTTAVWGFAVLMALRGLFMPLYRIGADAMVADIIPERDRADAYSLLRTVNNAGVAIGPSIGGFVAAASYTVAFSIAAGCLIFFSLFVLLMMRETLPAENRRPAGAAPQDLGYSHILHNRPFLAFVGAFTMIGMGSSLVFVLLGVYAKENYGIVESQIGFIMAANALMVVFFQYVITGIFKRFNSFITLAAGAAFYMVGIGSIALGSRMEHFILSMIILTIGELITVPTATSLTASLAPPDMRGRYMSFYWLGWSISHGLGPVVGGLMNDAVSPASIWLTGAAWNAAAVLIFLFLFRRQRRSSPAAA